MDLLHRIRWPNVARAAALLAAIALVAAWPRLRAEPPPLPGPEPVQAAPVEEAARPVTPPLAEPRGAEDRPPATRRSRRGGRARRRATGARKTPVGRPAAVVHRAPVARPRIAAPAPRPRRRAAPPSSAAREFRPFG